MTTIALIGFRGSGKSTLGSWLADALGLPFIDTDNEVLGYLNFDTVSDAWESVGEASWRAAEKQIIPLLLNSDGVVALGGGAPLVAAVAEALAGVSVVLNLCASEEVTRIRLAKGSDRPALSISDCEMRLQRLAVYRQLGTHVIDTSGDLAASKTAILAALH